MKISNLNVYDKMKSIGKCVCTFALMTSFILPLTSCTIDKKNVKSNNTKEIESKVEKVVTTYDPYEHIVTIPIFFIM